MALATSRTFNHELAWAEINLLVTAGRTLALLHDSDARDVCETGWAFHRIVGHDSDILVSWN